jgi:hypothetical protein
VSPVRNEVGFRITEDDILHSDRCENLKYYITLVVCGCPMGCEIC